MASSGALRGVRILAPVPEEYRSILSPEALAFIAHLVSTLILVCALQAP